MKFLKNGVFKAATSLSLAATIMFSGLGDTGLALAEGPTAPNKTLTKNIIVMISDGCGYNQVDAASLYQYGATGTQVYEKFPFKYGMSHYSKGETSTADDYLCAYDPAQAWSAFDYVSPYISELLGVPVKSKATDSAAAATAMSTGVKTYDAAIGVDINGQPLKHVAQKAEELGKATGVVTTVEFSHATPAGFVAHNVHRNNYEQIAQEMILSSATDVVMGTGNPWFDNDGQLKATPNTYKYVGGETVWNGLVAGTVGADADGDGIDDPWKLIQSRKDFQALMSGETPKRVCGVAEVYATTQQSRKGDAKAAPYVVPQNQNVPTLAEMSKGALNVLDNDSDGFFLMIEGGAIDWASHANQSGRVIEEEIDFNRAVEAVADWVEKNSNWGETLLIVTGDHETGYLTGPGSGFTVDTNGDGIKDAEPVWTPLVNNGTGNLPGMQWNSPKHTNSLIPLYAKGGAARLFTGYADEYDPMRGRYIDNTEIADLIFKVMR
ncbi:MAG TPA: alkaline phosphatase [Anaerolineae bacterium]|jgi:alkaline phosphatase|nr:alkaline phosphatase [Anaerolineae bacterium]